MINILLFDSSDKVLDNTYNNLENIEDVNIFKLSNIENIFGLLKNIDVSVIIVGLELLKEDNFTFFKEKKLEILNLNVPLFLSHSSSADFKDIEYCYDLGFNDNFTKPINPNILKVKIKSLINLKSSIDNISYCDIELDGTIRFASKKFLNQTGYDKKQLIKKSFFQMIYSVNSDKPLLKLFNTIEYGNKYNMVISLVDPFRDICAFDTTIIKPEGTDFVRLYFTDISTNLYLEKKLKSVLNSQNSIIVISDGKKILEINDNFFEHYPYEDLYDFKSKHSCICDLFEIKDEKIDHLQSKMGDSTWLGHILKNKNKLHHAYMIDKDGKERVYEVRIASSFRFWKKTEYIVIFNDITLTKELIQRNETSQVEFLEQANSLCELQLRLEQSLEQEQSERKAKEMFFANMSHEIRTPLNGIIGSLDNLEPDELNLDQNKYVSMCKSASKHLLSIVDDILDINKIQSDKFELNFEAMNLEKELVEIKEFFYNDFSIKNLTLDFIVDKKIPEYIDCDVKRLKQIIINLIGNSLKFTVKGGVTLFVKIKEQNDENIVLYFEVKDTGIGIEESNLNKIFQPYSQEDRTTYTKFGGTGLGTFIVKKLIEEFNSDIHIKSEVGVGTSIYFELDLNISKHVVQKNIEEIQERVFNKEDILIAEDNITNQVLIKALITKFNLTATVCSNGKEAFEQFTATPNKYKLILMDINMPILDGIAASEQIRAYEKENSLNNIPIIALSANAMAGDRQKYLSKGMNEYLSKPVDKKKLNILIGKYIDSSVSSKEIKEQKEEFSIDKIAEHFGVDADMMTEIVLDFVKDFNRQLKELNECLQINDSETSKALLHTIKGSTAELQLTELHKEIKLQEDNIKANKEVSLEKIIELKEELEESLA